MVKENSQLNRSKDKWNVQKSELEKWESDYYKKTFKGYRLRSREQKFLELFDSLQLKKGAKVLELGYGAGVTSKKILERGCTLVGVDISEPLAEIARKNCSQVEGAKYDMKVGDAENLTFKDNSFDCVVGLGFIHYMKSPLRCLQEAYRVLKPGGYLVLGQENIRGMHCLDGPRTLLFEGWRLLFTPDYEFDYRNTVILDIAIMVSKLFGLSMKKRLQSYKKIKLPKKHFLNYYRMNNYIRKSGFIVSKAVAAGFYSVSWHDYFSRKLSNKLQKWSDKRKIPYKFGNSLVFLAKKPF